MSYSKSPEQQWDGYCKSELGQPVTTSVGFHMQMWLFETLGFMSWWNHTFSMLQACISTWLSKHCLRCFPDSCVLLLLPLTDHMICTWAELEHTWGLMNSCNCDWLRVTMWHIDAWQSILLRDFLFLEGHKSTNAQWDSMYFVWRRSQTAVSLMPHQHRIMKLWRGFFEHENTTLALLLKSSPVKCWIKTFCLSLGPVPVWEIWLCVFWLNWSLSAALRRNVTCD